MSEITGVLFDIQRYSLHDGPGVRTVVFLKGCPLRCQWCCNPESWRIDPQLSFMPAKCIGCGACAPVCPNGCIAVRDGAVTFDPANCADCGRCAAVCYPQARMLSGRTVTVSQVLAEVEKDRRFYEHSGGGVTLSGGEATLQWAFAGELLRAARARYIHTAMETTGYAPWDHFWAVAQHADVVLYDIKHMDSALHKAYTGVGNERILANLAALVERKRAVTVRIPLIPGHNDDAENLEATARFLRELGGVREVHILPYHKLGISKYPLMRYDYPLESLDPPSQETVDGAEAVFRRSGFQTKVNG